MDISLPRRSITYTSGHTAGSGPTFRASVDGDWEAYDELYLDAMPIRATQEEFLTVTLQSRAVALPARFFPPTDYDGRINHALVVQRGPEHPPNQIVDTELEVMVKDGDDAELASATVELVG